MCGLACCFFGVGETVNRTVGARVGAGVVGFGSGLGAALVCGVGGVGATVEFDNKYFHSVPILATSPPSNLVCGRVGAGEGGGVGANVRTAPQPWGVGFAVTGVGALTTTSMPHGWNTHILTSRVAGHFQFPLVIFRVRIMWPLPHVTEQAP